MHLVDKQLTSPKLSLFGGFHLGRQPPAGCPANRLSFGEPALPTRLWGQHSRQLKGYELGWPLMIRKCNIDNSQLAAQRLAFMHAITKAMPVCMDINYP